MADETPWPVATAGAVGLPINLASSKYAAPLTGVVDGTASLLEALADGAAQYAANGVRADVIVPPGSILLLSQFAPVSGVRLLCYGAKIIPNVTNWATGAMIQHAANSPGLQDFAIEGGWWAGTGNEGAGGGGGAFGGAGGINQFLFQDGGNDASTDLHFHRMKVTNWGYNPFSFKNPTRLKVDHCLVIGNEQYNFGENNVIDIETIGTGGTEGGIIEILDNYLLNCRADAIAHVCELSGFNGAIQLIASRNIVSGQTPMFIAGCSTVGGDNVLHLPSVAGLQVGMSVWSGSSAGFAGGFPGSGSANPPFISSINAVANTATILLPSSPFNPAILPANANFTLWAGGDFVNSGALSFEVDTETIKPIATDFIFSHNIIFPTGTRGGLLASAPANGQTLHGQITDNLVANLYGGCIDFNIAAGNQYAVTVKDNSGLWTPPQITDGNHGTAGFTGPAQTSPGIGLRAGNRYTHGQVNGVATLVAGTVTIPTAEIVPNDVVLLNVIAAGGTRGLVQLGAIIAGTLGVTLTAGSNAVTLAAGTGTSGIAVPGNGTVVGVSSANAKSGLPPNATITVTGPTTGTLSANALNPSAAGIQQMQVGQFTINSVQPGTPSTLQNADTSTIAWKIDH
jgi:hypothetical protein